MLFRDFSHSFQTWLQLPFPLLRRLIIGYFITVLWVVRNIITHGLVIRFDWFALVLNSYNLLLSFVFVAQFYNVRLEPQRQCRSFFYLVVWFAHISLLCFSRPFVSRVLFLCPVIQNSYWALPLELKRFPIAVAEFKQKVRWTLLIVKTSSWIESTDHVIRVFFHRLHLVVYFRLECPFFNIW